MKKSTLQDSQPVQVWNNDLQSKALPFALIMTIFFLRLKKYLENTPYNYILEYYFYI
jgi:hypothetical protein